MILVVTPYNSHGYQRLREFAEATFTHVALVDDTGTEITRIDVTSDSRVLVTPDPTTNPLTYEIEVEATDDDIPRPVTIAETALYESDSDTDAVGTDTMKDATIEAPDDTVVVSHEQQLPPI